MVGSSVCVGKSTAEARNLRPSYEKVFFDLYIYESCRVVLKRRKRAPQLRILLGRSPGGRVWWPQELERLGLFPSCASCAKRPHTACPAKTSDHRRDEDGRIGF